MPVVIGAVLVMAGLWWFLGRGSASAAESEQERWDEAASQRAQSLKLWELVDTSGWGDKEREMLLAIQNHISAWEGKLVNTSNYKDFFASAERIWRLSGQGVVPYIPTLGRAGQMYVKTINAGPATDVRQKQDIDFKLARLGNYTAIGNAGTVMSNIQLIRGAAWNWLIMSDQAGEPDYRKPADPALEVSQAEFLGRMEQLCLIAWRKGQ